MPLYEYQCDACGKRFERIQKYSDPLVDTCSACGGVARRQLSSPAIQFKGTGWYITDYAKKPGNAGNDGGKSAPASETGGSGDKSPAAAAASTTESKSAGASGESGAGSSGSAGGSGGSKGASSSS